MASALNAVSPSYCTPSFSLNGTNSTMNGMRTSQTPLNSFEAPQSVASTPSVTPTASRGHQHILPHSIPDFSSQGRNHLQSVTPNGLREINGKMLQPRYTAGYNPVIYTANYSNVAVYEMEVNKIIVMRRRRDSWLNATQILKVAGIEKGKRTKVLEKEILAGEHEKIQGGYGKYQGTWVPYKRGVEFCHQYGVEELLRPLLEYDMGQDGVTAPGQGGIDTPTKDQAMAAQRKRSMLSEKRPSAQSPDGTFFKNISASAANAVNAIHKANYDPPGSRVASNSRRPITSQQSSQTMLGSQESAYQGSSQHSMRSIQSENSFGLSSSQIDPALRNYNPAHTLDHSGNGDLQEPPRKRVKSSNQDGSSQQAAGYDISMEDPTPTEANASYQYQSHGESQQSVDLSSSIGLPPLPHPKSNSALEKQQILTSLFIDPSQTDYSRHANLLHLSGEDLDMPIDASANTALHWAATLARPTVLRALIAKGGNIFRLNGGGETALMRAALTTNNLDQGSFPEVLELLGPTIEIVDARGRTILHHIAVGSAVKGRSAASRYYLESLLEFVVRQGSASNSQQTSFANGSETTSAPTKSIGLARFMSEIVNAVDMAGDTALNLAAKNGNKSIVQQLLEVGANPAIANRGGLKPVDFGIGGDPVMTDMQLSSQVPKVEGDPIGKVTETGQALISSLSALIADTSSSFRAELQAKQALIDEVHAKLREKTAQIATDRRHLSILRKKDEDRKQRRQRAANLCRANDEMCAQLANMTGSRIGAKDFRTDISIGEADAGLEIDATKLLPLSKDSSEPTVSLSPDQREYLNSLPPTEVLLARVRAYDSINHELEDQSKELQGRSTALEGQLRRIVSLCTGIEENNVDQMLPGLVAAVESEKEELDVGRVREFLRKVEAEG